MLVNFTALTLDTDVAPLSDVSLDARPHIFAVDEAPSCADSPMSMVSIK